MVLFCMIVPQLYQSVYTVFRVTHQNSIHQEYSLFNDDHSIYTTTYV